MEASLLEADRETQWNSDSSTSHCRNCPICDASHAHGTPVNYGPPEWPLVRCGDCGLVYLTRTPAVSELEQERAWEKTFLSERERRHREYPALMAVDRLTRARLSIFRRTPKRMIARIAPPGAILDLGCGTGHHLTPPPPGFVPYGIEISKQQAAAANNCFQSFGGECLWSEAEVGLASLLSGFFGAAMMISYLEHEFRPRQVLIALRRVLKNGAVVLVKVPHYGSLNRRMMGRRWCGFRFPDHVNYFTTNTLQLLAERSGYRIRYGLLERLRLPLSDSMWAVLRCN